MNQRPWKSDQTTYEGRPLYLRVPIGLDYEALQEKYTTLVVVTHDLSENYTQTVPRAEYDIELENLDAHVIEMFEKSNSGITVLVETYGIERNYYIYVSESADIKGHMTTLQSLYPDNHLKWTTKNDPNWKFIRQYARDYDL